MGLREKFNALPPDVEPPARPYLGPVIFAIDPSDPDGRGVWSRGHENAGDRAERKTRELLARQAIADDCDELSRAEMRSGRVEWVHLAAPLPLYHGFRDPPEPASKRNWIDTACNASAYAAVVCVLGCLWWLFT